MSIGGIGGFSFKCADPSAVREWYARHLGLQFSDDGGARFSWYEPDTDRAAYSTFRPFSETTSCFDPGAQPFMVNYRVAELDSVVEALRSADETVIEDEVERPEGRFAWAIDPDGQKVELWEPAEPAEPPTPTRHGHVQGLGGIFFRSATVTDLKAWYARLGILPGPDGYVTFPSRSADGAEAFTAWEIFPADTTYFDSDGESSPHPFMVNLRVEDLDGLLEDLRSGDVWIDPKTEAYEYGKFAWIVDPIGARIELWEAAPAAD